MQIGRTNASTGGGCTSDYDLWFEGFGFNQEYILNNSPNGGYLLHIYYKTDFINHRLPVSVIAHIYNPTTNTYTLVDTNASTSKKIFFNESNYFTNTHDGFEYVCVIYSGPINGSWYFRTYLPVVYIHENGNTMYSSIIWEGGYYSFYPYLRGLDMYTCSDFYLRESMEHLTFKNYNTTIRTAIGFNVSDIQIRILKNIVDNAPQGTNIVCINISTCRVADEKLADWLYNNFFYNYFNGT